MLSLTTFFMRSPWVKNTYGLQVPFLLGYYFNDCWAGYAVIAPRVSSYKLSVDIEDDLEDPSSKTKNKQVWGVEAGFGVAYTINASLALTAEMTQTFNQSYKNGTFATESYITYNPYFRPNNTTIKMGLSYIF